MKVGIVVPHIFMHRDILPRVIFSPGQLALDLAKGLQKLGAEVTLFTPGPVSAAAPNVTADMSYFEQELAGRGDSYTDLLKKHPFTFITLARQVQSELIAKAYSMANDGELDVVHVYTNEEDIGLPFASLCAKPVVFTHHDPFNFLVKYKNVFPKYRHLNWLSMSLAQRAGMPADTNWIGNIYHGLDGNAYRPVDNPSGGYIAYLGRIIEPKGLHLAIDAFKETYKTNTKHIQKLRVAGKHYAGKKDEYWKRVIEPNIDGDVIEYVGHISQPEDKRQFIANADAVIVPSTFQEPFGMVLIEALACGTPVIGLDSGAIPEVIRPGKTGFLVNKDADEAVTVRRLSEAIGSIEKTGAIDRVACRRDFEERFTLERMCSEHLLAYTRILSKSG